MRGILCGLVLALAASLAAHAQNGPRLALLIANEDYPGAPQALTFPARDAATLRAALEEADFDVTVVRDADEDAILTAVEDFTLQLDDAGPDAVGFFYYAGHGAVGYADGRARNFMMPAGEEIRSEASLLQRGVRLDRQIDAMATAGASALFVVYDACRNSLNRGETRGFAPPSARSGLLIAMSTTDGSTTPEDGRYAAALAAQLRLPGQRAVVAFSNASAEVGLARQQEGRENEFPELSPRLTGPFCFRGCEGGAAPVLDEADIRAQSAFDFAQTVGTAAAWEAFLSAHGDSRYAVQARVALARLRPNSPESALASIADMPGPGDLAIVAASPVDGAAVHDGAQVTSDTDPGLILQDCPDCPEMVVIPAGSFTMGSPASEQSRFDSEGPRRTVRIARPFAVGRFEVTWDEWEVCVSAGGCDGSGPNVTGGDEGWGRGRRPVINVDWGDAQDYADWLSERTGDDYRLLSEAEWEYAARAGTTTRYAFGDSISGSQARFNMSSTVEVGSYRPNAFGLYDMHGNVYEWTQDCWNRSYAGAPSDGRAWESGDCSRRVLRGGSWHDSPQTLRSAIRSGGSSDDRTYSRGFRVARTVSP